MSGYAEVRGSVPALLLLEGRLRVGEHAAGRVLLAVLPEVFAAVGAARPGAAADRRAEVAVGLALEPGRNFLKEARCDSVVRNDVGFLVAFEPAGRPTGS